MIYLRIATYIYFTPQTHSLINANTPNHSYQTLPCPPLFDGDYWPEEMARLAQALRRRALAQLTGMGVLMSRHG